ncbi:MAG TPA: HDIG domain-containing protein, partial [Bacteroidia bacterium]|nr:HDIG domain-containing protein [Bacteroidia bacterium]
MKKALTYLWNKHSEMYKIFIFLMTLVIIVFLFPKQAQFKYDIAGIKGKPWQHENLIAPFNFSIKKSPQELTSEKNEILKKFKPYFKVNDTILDGEKNLFKVQLLAAENDKFFQIRKKVFDPKNKNYLKGIVQLSDVLDNKMPDFSIYVVNNNVASEKELSDLFTVQTAFNYMKQAVTSDENCDKKLLLPVLENCIQQNIFYDKDISDKAFKQQLEGLSPVHEEILKDQSIIGKGEIVDAKKYEILQSLKDEYEGQSTSSSSYFFILAGQIIVVAICLSVLFSFIYLFRKNVYADNSQLTFILLMIVLFVLMALVSAQYDISIYILPFCILPIMVRAFFDTRVALFTHLVNILILSFLAPNRFEFIFLELVVGMVAIFSILNMRKRSQIFYSAGIIFVMYCLAFIGISIIQGNAIEAANWHTYLYFLLSAGFTIFAYPLIFVFEKTFGFISDVSLMELSDTNNPLLRELASKAPGTFQHSLQVANLAEEAIYSIGGNSQLVRTGALYHDIGKMDMPFFFIENQSTGVNPHEDLAYEESSSIIISHVIRGIEKARKHKIPEKIIDFIRTHHGTTLTAYFYNSYKKEAADGGVLDEESFRYPGPIPYSKETAVLMMADSVEAASRSLKTYDEETIEALIDQIING